MSVSVIKQGSIKCVDCIKLKFQHFCIFVPVCPVMLFDSPATLDNDSGVVYDSDYNDYSVVLRDK